MCGSRKQSNRILISTSRILWRYEIKKGTEQWLRQSLAFRIHIASDEYRDNQRGRSAAGIYR